MAQIKIDIDRKKGVIDRKIYGQFIEHLGRCIYGGIFEEGSPLSNSKGFRQDVMEVVESLRVPILRWPGGNFSSGYHWQDGIGPKDKRPPKWDMVQRAVESNRFGTDEFLEYCRVINAEPYICTNLGNGTPEEAASWVEYCNGTNSTYFANLRRKNGHEKPCEVKYWGLGNEIYGSWQIGEKNAKDYAKIASESAKAMKLVDPEIELIAVGWDFDWNLEVLRKLGQYLDYLSLHLYVDYNDYYDRVAGAIVAEKEIRICNAAIDIATAQQWSPKRIKIAFDEWNVWFRSKTQEKKSQIYNLGDTLLIATFLNTFQRNCATVGMATMAQMVNNSAPIIVAPEGVLLQTTYFPLKLYAEKCGNICLDVWVESETYSSKNLTTTSPYPGFCPNSNPLHSSGGSSIPYLDASATFDPENRWVTLAVVNRNENQAIHAKVECLGFKPKSEGQIFEINGKRIETENSFDEPDNIGITEKICPYVSSDLNYNFPAHSVTLIRMSL